MQAHGGSEVACSHYIFRLYLEGKYQPHLTTALFSGRSAFGAQQHNTNLFLFCTAYLLQVSSQDFKDSRWQKAEHGAPSGTAAIDIRMRSINCYSDLLRAGRSGDRIPVRVIVSAPVQIGPGTHSALSTMSTGFVSRSYSGRSMATHPHLSSRLKKE